MNKLTTACVIGVAAVALTACTSANTGSGEVALHYSGGALSSQTFENCVSANTLDWDGPGDFHYYYQVGPREFNFNSEAKHDSDPLTASTKGSDGQPGIELSIVGQVKFNVTTDCGKLQKFHESIGGPRQVASKDVPGEFGSGWSEFITNNIKLATDQAVDIVTPNYTPNELYNDPDKRAQWTKKVQDMLPALINDKLGTEELITVQTLTLQRPNLPQAVKQGLEDRAAATIRQENAQIDIKTANDFGGMKEYTEYLNRLSEIAQQNAITRGINEGRLAPAVVPQGTSVMIAK